MPQEEVWDWIRLWVDILNIRLSNLYGDVLEACADLAFYSKAQSQANAVLTHAIGIGEPIGVEIAENQMLPIEKKVESIAGDLANAKFAASTHRQSFQCIYQNLMNDLGNPQATYASCGVSRNEEFDPFSPFKAYSFEI